MNHKFESFSEGLQSRDLIKLEGTHVQMQILQLLMLWQNIALLVMLLSNMKVKPSGSSTAISIPHHNL